MTERVVVYNVFPKRCQHNKFEVNESLALIKCGTCGEPLNPIWCLAQFARAESRYQLRITELEKTAAKAEKKNKCKCEHCKKMTRIHRE